MSEGSLGLQSWLGAHANQSWRPVFNRLQGRFDTFKSNVTKRLDTREATVTCQLRSLYDYTKELCTNLVPRVEALESWQRDEEAGIAGSAKMARQQTGRQANQPYPPSSFLPVTPRSYHCLGGCARRAAANILERRCRPTGLAKHGP